MFLSLEKYLIYRPMRQFEFTPNHEGLEYEEVHFPASDGIRLHGWLVPARGARHTLVWFHGNAGNISHWVNNIGCLNRTLGVNVFIFDYRGFGHSDGRLSDLSEEATYRDADGAVAFLRGRAELARTRFVYFGQSLGCPIAIEAARRRPAAGLILETPLTSIRDMARRHYPLLPRLFIRTEYDSLAKIGDVRAPLLVLHGDRDDHVPLEQAQRIYAAANEPKTLYVIRGAAHNDTYVVGGAGYFDAWARFLNTLDP
jgi:uncharacterized protein